MPSDEESPSRRVDDFVVDDVEPGYLALLRDGDLRQRVATARAMLRDCRACPRECGVDRRDGRVGICRTGRLPVVASAFPHTGEESCLSGRRGSGTIFFSHCNLHCVFCQNWSLSQRLDGEACEPEKIADAMLQLQQWGCHNINFVTPEHVAPQVVEAIVAATARGLRIPIVYNTSAYDGLSVLELLEGMVDVYMPDFKFWQLETARRLAKARDYPERARAAIRRMHDQVGPLKLDRDGLAARGLLVRHLVLPGHLDETSAIFEWLASAISPDTYVNIMGQYRPAYRVGRRLRDGTIRYASIARPPTPAEMEAAYMAARRAGLWRFDGMC